jgi:hypothetical protein
MRDWNQAPIARRPRRITVPAHLSGLTRKTPKQNMTTVLFCDDQALGSLNRLGTLIARGSSTSKCAAISSIVLTTANSLDMASHH